VGSGWSATIKVRACVFWGRKVECAKGSVWKHEKKTRRGNNLKVCCFIFMGKTSGGGGHREART